MINNRIIQLTEEALLSPYKLFFRITYNSYYMLFSSVVGSAITILLILNIILAGILKNNFFVNSLYCFIFILIIFPITIALEEFFHASTAIARGKKDTINSFVIGYYERKNKNIFPAYFAISYFGNFNIIDKLYISAAGPVSTIYVLIISMIFSNFISTSRIVKIAMLINLVIPFVGLIPSRFVVQSDGYSIVEAIKKLNMPWNFAFVNLAVSPKYALRYLIKPKRVFENDYVNPRKVLGLIEKYLDDNNMLDAVNAYKKLLKIDPYNCLYLNNTAWILYEMGRHREALVYIKRCMKLSNNTEEYRDTYKKVIAALEGGLQVENVEVKNNEFPPNSK